MCRFICTCSSVTAICSSRETLIENDLWPFMDLCSRNDDLFLAYTYRWYVRVRGKCISCIYICFSDDAMGLRAPFEVGTRITCSKPSDWWVRGLSVTRMCTTPSWLALGIRVNIFGPYWQSAGREERCVCVYFLTWLGVQCMIIKINGNRQRQRSIDVIKSYKYITTRAVYNIFYTLIYAIHLLTYVLRLIFFFFFFFFERKIFIYLSSRIHNIIII